MASGTEPPSSFVSRISTSADTCDSCTTDGADLEHARPRASRDRALFPTAETVLAVRYTLCFALASAVVAVVLFGITGAVWYRYVLRPDVLIEPTRAARSQEQQPKVLVVVVQGTEGVSSSGTKPTFLGSDGSFRASAGTVSVPSNGGTGPTAQPQRALTGHTLPAPL